MNRLWTSITTLLSIMPQMAQNELRSLRNSLLWLIGFLYGMFFVQLAFNSYVVSSVVGLVLAIISGLIIFTVRRIINLTVVGEALELLHITPAPKKTEGGAAGIIVNPVSTLFWDVSLQVFFFVLIACLLVPTLPLRNNPVILIIFPTLALAIALAFKGTALLVVNRLSSVFILALMVYQIGGLFPQIKYYTNNLPTPETPSPGLVSSEAAAEANKVDELRKIQRTEALKKTFQRALAWQKMNPGRDLPDNMKREVAAANQGLTIAEYEAKNLAPPIDAPGSITNPPPAQNQLLSAFPATIKIAGGKSYFETREIKTGKYRVVPSDTKVNLGEGWNARNKGEFEITNSRQTIGVLSPSGSSTVTIFQR